jgi:hypothetical protein
MKKSGLLLAALLVSAATIGCKKTQKVSCDGSAPTYESFVKNLVNTKCVSCHGSYSSYQGLSSITSSGLFEKEVLINQTMPEGGSLSQDELNKLQCWVDNGFPEN